MLVLASLVLTGAIEPSEVFLGFSSFAVITIAGLMVIGEALVRTGVVRWVARRLERVIGTSRNRLLLINTGIPGLLSGFVNIVAAVSFFIPVILRLCKKTGFPQSKVLLPMACTALLGANLTLIGASHNLVVHSLLEEASGEGFAFFEFSAVGAALLLAALVYIFAGGRRLLPGDEQAPAPADVSVTPNLIKVYGLERRLFELWVSDDVEEGLRLSDLALDDHGLTLITMIRGGERLVFPGQESELAAGDLLLVQGREDVVQKYAQERPTVTFIGTPHTQLDYPLSMAELAEAVVPPRSSVVGQTIAELDLTREYGMTAIAIYRRDHPHRTGFAHMKLEEGDSILMYGPREKMREFEPKKELLIYFRPGEPAVSSRRKRLAPIAVAILLLVVVVAALEWFPIAVTAVAGAVLVGLLGMVPVEEAYDVIDWRTLVLIGGMYPLGVALGDSGAADVIGETLIVVLGDFGPLAVLAGIAVLTMALTQTMHNAAVAVIMAPIAINAANLMESSPTGFCVGVVVACSASFLLPFGHPASLLVQAPGGYTGGDYLRFGIGLNVIALLVTLLMVPLLWPV
jgi:di/tricarboxylate transporter